MSITNHHGMSPLSGGVHTLMRKIWDVLIEECVNILIRNTYIQDVSKEGCVHTFMRNAWDVIMSPFETNIKMLLREHDRSPLERMHCTHMNVMQELSHLEGTLYMYIQMWGAFTHNTLYSVDQYLERSPPKERERGKTEQNYTP